MRSNSVAGVIALSASILAGAGCSSAAPSSSNAGTGAPKSVATSAGSPSVLLLRRVVGHITPHIGGTYAKPPSDQPSVASADAKEIIRASKEALSLEHQFKNSFSVMEASMNGDISVLIYRDTASKTSTLLSSPGSTTSPPPPHPSVAMAFSYDTDDRTDDGTGSGLSDGDPAVGPVGRLISSGGNGTGTLFSHQLVFTSASLMFDNYGNVMYPTFIPRARGSVHPFGQASVIGHTWPSQFTALGCNVLSNYTTNYFTCLTYNVAWARINNSQLSSQPPYEGFAWASDSTEQGWVVSNEGYPDCVYDLWRPSNCQSGQPYGDHLCDFVTPIFGEASPSLHWPFSDGTNPIIETGCDTSEGHMGGPFYTPTLGGDHIFAEAAWPNTVTYDQYCVYSSGGVRISQQMFSYMLSLKQSYP